MGTLEDQRVLDEYGQDGRSVTNVPAFSRIAKESIGSTMHTRFEPPLWMKATWFVGVPVGVIVFFWLCAILAR